MRSTDQDDVARRAREFGASRTVETFEARVTRITRQVRDLLVEKNAKYGNSALDPCRIFSKASPVEQILVRIDDKLSRIRASGLELPDEDTALDLIGYLVLLRIAREAASGSEARPS